MKRSIVAVGFFSLILVDSFAFATESYFPIRQNKGDGGISSFKASWYGKSLRRMNEPRLPSLASNKAVLVYRFMALPTWGNPISVRAQKGGQVYSVSSRRLNGQGGYDPGKLGEQMDITLSESDSKTLERLFAVLNFFQMSTDEEVLGADGTEWILEVVSEGKYHVVNRWCANEYDPQKRGLEPFMAFCKFLIERSGLAEWQRIWNNL
jgi:hypothetical protein